MADLGSSASKDRREAPRPPPRRRSRYTSINTRRRGGLGRREGGQGAGPGRVREDRGITEMHFPTLPLPRVETHLPITSHSSYTSSNSTSSSAMVRRGQWPQRGGLRKRGWGRQRAQCPAPDSPPPLRTREPSVLRTLERGCEARRLRRLPLRATAPARAAGPGRWSEGGPGPAPPARPLLLALLGPRCPACGSSGTARRLALLLSARASREAATAPSVEAGSGAARGSSGYWGGRGRTMEGGSPRREVAAADRRWGPGGGGRDAPSSFSSSRRRRRPPAWEWEGASRDWLSVRAGAAAAAFSSSSASAADQLASPAHPPRADTPSPPPTARLPEPQAPPTPARREAVAEGKGAGLSGACVRRGSRHGEPAGAGNLEGAGGWGARAAAASAGVGQGRHPRDQAAGGVEDKRSATERTFLAR